MITHCALDHARAVARSRPDNKQGYNAITYKNNAVSSGLGGYSISFCRNLSYNKATLQICQKELGDVALYLAEAATALDVPLETILRGNLDKLQKCKANCEEIKP